MYLHAVSLDTGVGPYIDGAKWGNGVFLCGANQTFDIIESEHLHPHSVTLLRWTCSPFCHLTFAWAATGELQWPQHDCPKVGLSPCCGSLCKLPHNHETQSLVYYLYAHHDQNCLGVGYGGDNQQQHILIIVSYPQNLEVYLYKSEVLNGCTPNPSSSNNWPRGWMCRVSSLQNWTLMLNTWVPEFIKAVTSCLSIITGASLEQPTRCAMGSGLRNGIEAMCCCPFLLAAFIRVSFGLGSGREWCKFIDCGLQGVWLHSLSSPMLV